MKRTHLLVPRTLKRNRIVYIKKSVSLPKDIWLFMQEQKRLPQHAGSLSSVVRWMALDWMKKSRKQRNYELRAMHRYESQSMGR